MSVESWYTILNTIAQTLAGVVGLGFAVAVFRFDFILTQIIEVRKRLRRFMLLLTSAEQSEIHTIEPLSDNDFLKTYSQALNKLNRDDDTLGFNPEMYKKLENALFTIIIHSEWDSFYSAKKGRILGFFDERKSKLEALIEIKSKILLWLKCSLLISILSIIVSLVVIPFYTPENTSYIWIIVAVAVFSLLVTARAVWKIVATDNRWDEDCFDKSW